MVIATATSRDGDDFSFFLLFFGDAPNVLVLMRARDVERREEGRRQECVRMQDFFSVILKML